MKKILAVFTGGTIGSRIEGGTIGLPGEKAYPLLEAYRETYGDSVEFEAAEPFRILSENSTPLYLKKLIEFLREKDLDAYDGILVTHGSDTLPYTAAFLGYYLGRENCPVLLLSSRSPLGQPDSNGLQHLKAAVDFIAEDRYQGVFVPFQNEPGEPVSIYLATRLLEADSWQDRFSSFDGGRLGSMREGHFVYEDTPENPPLASFLKKRDGYRKAPLALPETAPSVMKLHPYPGLDYSRLNLEGVQAVFHGTYHSGTLCTEGEDENGCRFVERAAQAGIPVYFGPVKSGRMQYQSVEGFLQAGAIPVSDCSEIAAYVKLLIGCSLKKRGQQLEQFMQETLYFERMEKSAM